MLNLNFSKTDYRPGETISGELTWNLDRIIKSIELRLTWVRLGVGDPEAVVVDTRQIPGDSPNGRAHFQFMAPAAPYSFMGALFAINWLVEASTNPPTTAANFEFVIAPSTNPIIMLLAATPAR